VLAEKMLQFKLPAASSVRVPAGEAQGFTPYLPPRACGSIRPPRKYRSSRQPMGVLPPWGGRRWMWGTDLSAPHMLGWRSVRGDSRCPRVGRWKFGFFSASVLTLAAAFFFGFPAAGLVAAVDFGLGFLGPAVFLVAVTLGCMGASVTGW